MVDPSLPRPQSGRPLSTSKSQHRAKLWQAMLAIAPAIIGSDLKHAPEGAAQLVREHAQALLAEWRSAARSIEE